MKARLRIPEDEDAIIELARIQSAETHPHLTFNEALGRATFRRAIRFADPIIFVAEDDEGAVVGSLIALLHPYMFHTGFCAAQEVISVRPDKRGSRAAALLIELFNRWADDMEPEEVFMGVSNGRKVIKFARFVDWLTGCKPVGIILRRIPVRGANGQQERIR